VLSTLLILALLPAVFAVVACLLFGALMLFTSALTARALKPVLADPEPQRLPSSAIRRPLTSDVASRIERPQ
jgi:hypothetical protein